MHLKPFYSRFGFVIFLLFGFAEALFSKQTLPEYGKVPDFSLTDQNGDKITLSDLEDGVWIANFMFTRCQNFCPMLSARMADLQLRLERFQIKLISFSVDPEYDTPHVLAAYASKYGARTGRWLFLTGNKSDVWNLITDGFSLGVGEASAEDLAQGAEPVMHTNRFVLVDRSGTIRGYYDTSDSATLEKLVQDASELSQGAE